MCIVKNEGDILEHTLECAQQWAHKIFIYDGYSSDNTWETATKMANRCIIPWRRHNKPYGDELRKDIFDEFKSEARKGDWWCRLDADEIYIGDPRDTLTRIRPWEHVVWGVAVDFVLTKQNVKEIADYSDVKYVLSRLRHYYIKHSQARFFRHRPGLQWPEGAAWPRHLGVDASRRVFYRHYKYRSPSQIEQRCQLRVANGSKHWMKLNNINIASWEDVVLDERDLSCLTNDDQCDFDTRTASDYRAPLSAKLLKIALHAAGIFP